MSSKFVFWPQYVLPTGRGCAKIRFMKRHIYASLLVLIILLGFTLRNYGLGHHSLWYDETVSAYLAGQPVAALVAHTARDIHPPGYYLLLRGWTMLAGSDEFALAYLSLLFGLLLIPLTARLAHYLFGWRPALWAALLVAVSPYNIWYSQEVRMYTLGATAGIIAGGCAFAALHHSHRQRRCWAMYVVAAVTGLYALYYFSFLLVALNLFFLGSLLLPRPRPDRLWLWLAANVLVLLAYLPWLPVAWRQATNPPVPPWRSLPPLPGILLEAWSALSLGQSVRPGQVWPLLLLTAALVLLGILYSWRQKGTAITLFLLVYTFGPGLLVLLFSLVIPLYHVRYLFTYAPPFYILLAAGLAWLGQRFSRQFSAIVAAVLVLGALMSLDQYYNNPQYQSDDFRAAVAFMDNRWQPGDEPTF
jgi:mannosyltransferase